MHVASVTLDEVLRAAAARAAALVPETAGYLALAIGDASARLPYRLEDGLVTLTTEGTVRVARGRETVSPEEGARVLRELLRRLFAVSAGTMPGLAAAATARAERSGPEVVIAEIEAALIPVNRAAARRSLARLARDTTRARDAGRLATAAPPVLATSPAAHAPPAAAHHPAPPAAYAAQQAAYAAQQAAYAAQQVAYAAHQAAYAEPAAAEAEVAPVFDVIVDYEPETPFQPALAVPRHQPEPEEVPQHGVGLASEEVTHRLDLPEPTVIDAQVLACVVDPEPLELAPITDVESVAAVAAVEALPDRMQTPPRPAMVVRAPAIVEVPSEGVDTAARSLEHALRGGRIVAAPASPVRRSTARRAPWQADLASASPSDVDTLLASFRPSDAASDSTAMRRDLKKLVGIDATQLPPRVVDSGRGR